MGIGDMGPLDRHVPAVIPRYCVLLVAALVFFIHDYQTKIGHRGENRRPGADHDIRLAFFDALPLRVSLRAGELRMQNR